MSLTKFALLLNEILRLGTNYAPVVERGLIVLHDRLAAEHTGIVAADWTWMAQVIDTDDRALTDLLAAKGLSDGPTPD